MAVFNWGALGGGPNIPARWNVGATPGVTLHASWVSQAAWGDSGENAGRTWVVFEAENQGQAAQVTAPLNFLCSKIEVWPLTDYLPQMKAYWSGDPAEWPAGVNQTEEQTARQRELAEQYKAAPNPVAAVEIWKESGPGAAAAVESARVHGGGG